MRPPRRLAVALWALTAATGEEVEVEAGAADGLVDPARGAEIAAWTHAYSSQRAGYYLTDARRMLDKAMKHYSARKKGSGAPDPYLKIWDAQSQISAAISWDNASAEVWFEAGNLTFTLAGLMREIEEGDLLQDALAFWAHALNLEADAPAAPAAPAEARRPLARRLRAWLEELLEAAPAEMRRRLPQRLWLKVRKDAWAEVQRWDSRDNGRPPVRAVRQRRPGRVAKAAAQAAPVVGAASTGQCSSGGGACAGTSGEASPGSGNWLADKVGAGKEIVFPTYIYRVNLFRELGSSFFDKLSKVAADKYADYRRNFIREHGHTQQEHSINDAFFQFQETMESALLRPEGRQQWPELYNLEEFQKLLVVARNASLAYLRHSGTDVTPEEVDSSWLVIWTAVYPQDPLSKGRHGWHTHQESVVSGVLYANPRRTPLLFADPRGAPPIEDYEQYRQNDLLFEPKAPFDAHYQFFAEPGDLVLFPSWLVHKVPPPVGPGGDGFRVVFPFNFHLGSGRRSSATIWDGWERTVPVVPA